MYALDVVVDGRTSRFLKLVQSAQLTEELPKTSAKRMVGMAPPARFLGEGGGGGKKGGPRRAGCTPLPGS